MSEAERQIVARQGFTRALRRHLPGVHYEGCTCKACAAIEREADTEYPLTAPGAEAEVAGRR